MGIELFAMAMAVAQVAIYLGLIGETSFWRTNKALLGSNHKSYSINVHKDTGHYLSCAIFISLCFRIFHSPEEDRGQKEGGDLIDIYFRGCSYIT